MLKPEQMSRLLIVASKDQMAPVVTELYRHNLFHIEDYVEAGAEGYEGFKIGSPLPGATEASGDLVKIRAIENAFSIRSEDFEVKQRRKQSGLQVLIEHELPAIEQEVEGLTVNRSKLETKLKEYEQKVAELTPFTGIPGDLDLYRGYSRFVVFAGYVEKEVLLSVPHEMFFSKGKGRHFTVVIAAVEQRSEVEGALQEAGYQAVPIPDESGVPQERISFYSSQITLIKKEIEDINQKLDAIKEKHADFLIACEEILKVQVDQTEAPLRFATTNETFVAEGWVPTNRVDAVSDSLTNVTGGKIFITVLPIDIEHDVVPVEYDNPSFAKPTQMLMDVYSRPKFTELDPTLILSIIFPLFFGLILGDVGYGLLLLGMCLVLRKYLKGEDSTQLLTVLRNASFSSILFGLLYSEFLGFELPWKPIMFSRHLKIGGGEAGGQGPAIPELMMFAIWIGILHITLGRILGVINHARQDHGDHRIKAVMANFGWLAVMWGLLIMIWTIAALPLMPDFTTLPKVVMGLNVAAIVGVVMLIVGTILIARDSALEIVELPTIISHVISYARIVAVGLSSVAIAMVVNFIAIGLLITPQLKNITIIGVLFIIMGVAVFLIGHALNMALGILGGGLHSIRLHYVEFFTKFYKGGGKKYSPFGYKRRFTED
ncbi:MAG: V-type ATP synthase subunit I [Methanoregula sp.]|jgi:V/A-type H+-transporting ATPase subunit I